MTLAPGDAPVQPLLEACRRDMGCVRWRLREYVGWRELIAVCVSCRLSRLPLRFARAALFGFRRARISGKRQRRAVVVRSAGVSPALFTFVTRRQNAGASRPRGEVPGAFGSGPSAAALPPMRPPVIPSVARNLLLLSS